MPYYVLFDTETTGNQPEDRILQVGAMMVHKKDEVEIYNELCRPPLPIKIEAMEVHGITPELIQDKPPYTQTRFAQRIASLNSAENYLIAHNIDFDLGMIEKEGFRNRMQTIDTVRCARHLFPTLPAHRLQYLRYALKLYRNEAEEATQNGIVIKAHDALGDVLILKLLFGHLIQTVRAAFPGINPVEKLVKLTQTPVLIATFKFGKYKGKSIEEIARTDAGYLAWMRKNLDLDDDMRYTLDQYIS